LCKVVLGRDGTDKGAVVVSGVLREQRHLILRRPTGRNQEKKVGSQGRETGRANDGLWYSHSVRL
jgi:hypothetical protein